LSIGKGDWEENGKYAYRRSLGNAFRAWRQFLPFIYTLHIFFGNYNVTDKSNIVYKVKPMKIIKAVQTIS